ncbi:MAG: hypothetical protein A2W98_06955 [Bacteroidetes bacterium GWF2_33_38]|nr:MAG: hypothetical protein A2W98_06955 [Bacteroidetes bacterium GWF2_33_38]
MSYSQLIISQYIETNTGTTPKGIELWNNSGATIDFSVTNLKVMKGSAGGPATTSDYTLSTGTLADGAVIVIGTDADVLGTGTGFKDYVIGNGADFYTKGFTFNGDDPLVILLGGVIQDILGDTTGVDPAGTGWAGNGVQTYNQNISLISGITTGATTTWTDPSLRFETTTTDNALTGFGIAPGAIVPPSDDARLSDISIDGISITDFDAATYSYTVELPNGTVIVPTVTYTLMNSAATVVQTDALSLPGTTTLDVTAEDGTTTLSYEVNFTLAPAGNTDATLNDLLVDGLTVTGFDSLTLIYNVELSSGVTVVPTVTYVLNDVNATAAQVNAAGLPGTTTIEVTAENGSEQMTYVINFYFAPVPYSLIISQYIETSIGTTPKGIELWNNSGNEINFEATPLKVMKGSAGGAATTTDFTLSAGTLADGDVMVIGTDADTSGTGTGFKDYVIGNGADFYTKGFTFNGDDPLVILLGGVVQDIFGDTTGVDPAGTGWAGNGVQTYNQNIRLKDGIESGSSTTWTDPSLRFDTVSTSNSLFGFGLAPGDPLTSEVVVKKIANLYPNPTFDKLYVDGLESITKITISNTLGQSLLNIEVNTDKVQLNLASFAKGLYFVSLINGKEIVSTYRIVKK